MNTTLIMTLLVKNEADIVRQNIEFHLACGVDHVIAVDNDSSDGTREILLEFERAGSVSVIGESGQDFAQSKWMTRAALLARDRFSADWILSNDADEFWWCASGRLKDHLVNIEASKLFCRRSNMVYAYDSSCQKPWHQRLTYKVAAPVALPRLSNIYTDCLPAPFFYLDLRRKVLVRGAGLKYIGQGNHEADFDAPVTAAQSEIQIYHFPVRSPELFRQKITQGAEAYARNREFSTHVGWHWRRWHRMMLAGGLQSALADALPSAKQLATDLQTGRVVEDRTMCDLINEHATVPSNDNGPVASLAL